VLLHRLAEEALGCRNIASFTQQEVYRSTQVVHCSIHGANFDMDYCCSQSGANGGVCPRRTARHQSRFHSPAKCCANVRIALAMVEEAIIGKMQAASEIADRVEGRVRPRIEADSEEGFSPVSVIIDL